MDSDTTDSKKVSIEKLSKDEIINKYNKVLMVAKKAKQSKDEMAEELRKIKENEKKLMKEVEALKETLNFYDQKQKEFAENENKIKQIEGKNKEVNNLLLQIEEKYSLKIVECTKLEETLQTLSAKFTSLEKKHFDTLEKFEKVKGNLSKHEFENKLLQEKMLLYETNNIKNKNENQEEITNNEKDNINENIPEKWKKLIIENKKLQDFLNESENTKTKLISELNLLRESQECFKKHTEDSDNSLVAISLKKGNGKNFNVNNEKIDMVLSSFECEEFQNKLALWEEEKKNFDFILEESRNNFKALEEKFEKEKHEWDIKKRELEIIQKNQELELESNLKVYKKKVEDLIKENKDLKNLIKEEKAFGNLKILEKEKVFQTNQEYSLEKKATSSDSSTKLSNLVEKIKLFSENATNLDENKFNEEIQKLLEIFQEVMYEKLRDGEQKLEKEQENFQRIIFNKENKVKVEGENSKGKRQNLQNPLEEMDDYCMKYKELQDENKELSKKVKQLKKITQFFLKVLEENGEEKIYKSLFDSTILDKNEKEYFVKILMEECEITENSEIKFDLNCLDQALPNLKKKENNLQQIILDNENEKSREIFGNDQHILAKENVFFREEIEIIKHNYEETMKSIKIKLEELLFSFSEIKTLRYNFDEELKKKFKAFQLEQSKTKKNIDDVLTKYVGQLHNGNSELLSEMNDMNQVLKERGETISKLEQLIENQRKELEEAKLKISNQSSKLAEKNKKMEEMEEEIGKAKLEVENKHRAMREMEEEMWEAKNNDSQIEVLSSSTLSRADESSRLTELEESFEEKYSKLKIVAFKLKKKTNDLQKQFEAERNKLITTESEYQNKISNFHNQIKSLRNIQKEYDILQDVLEEEKKKKNDIKKTLESTQQELLFLKQQFEDMKAEKEKLKNDKKSFEKIKTELTVHLKESKQTIEKLKKDYSQLEIQVDEAKNQLTIKNRHIEEEKEKHKQAMLLLEESKQDSKKHSVLELEMAAYEKTAEELKNRLDLKEKEIKELQNQIEMEKKTRILQTEEINNLKTNISDGNIRELGFNKELKLLTEELNSQKLNTQAKIEQIKELEKNIEERNLRIENLCLELKEITKEKFNHEEKFRNTEEKFFRQINALEDKLFSLEDTLRRKEIELEELKEEYQAYKIRAQSVLRQSQKDVNLSKQQNALEELEQLKNTSESLKTRLEESNKKIKDLLEENTTHQEEKKRLFVRVQELNLTTTELRKENHELKELKQKENEEHVEALRMQKHHSDTLAQCFQRQIHDLEVKYAAEIEALKKKQEENKEDNLVFFKNVSKPTVVPEKRKTSIVFEPLKSEKEILDITLFEREECEGSESVNSSPQSPKNSNFMSLEQLLNDQSDSVCVQNTNQDVEFIRNQLEKSDNKIKHLTFLLSEAESDSARINQLNKVLKEEIRRLQRSIEREKHAQNFEYLKNIIIKFVSLQNVDEKLRLVPVLNTILKLSQEEETVLFNFAKGVVETGKRGWGINLGIWPNV